MYRLKPMASNQNALRAGDIPALAGVLDDSSKAKKMIATGIYTDRIDQFYDVRVVNGVLAEPMSRAQAAAVLHVSITSQPRLGFLRALDAARGSPGSGHL
jgi:galactokinase/mevalonate kinase-like predicted kinase